MNAAIISIGDELLIGQTINTNASYIGENLSAIGVEVQTVFTISDKEQDILSTLSLCQNKYQLVVLTGGLGPTNDDITKLTLAKYLGAELVINEEVLENVQAFFKSYGRSIKPVNELQAQVPVGSEVLMNDMGTAPGMWMRKSATIFVSLPGVPREMRYLVKEKLLSKLQENFELPIIYSHHILTQGIGESYIAEEIADIEEALPQGLSLAYLPSRGLVKLRVTGRGASQQKVEQVVHQQVRLIEKRIERHVFGSNQETLSGVIGGFLRRRNMTVSVAESLTGGALGQEITGQVGSSAYFLGGVLSYDAQVKIRELGVDPEIIEQHTSVCEQVATQMASGARSKFKSDFSIATTGLAGPQGGSEEVPVGTVYVAIASRDGVVCKHFTFGGERSGVVRRTVLASLNMLRILLQDIEK